jgi:hypothetical protein
LSAARTLHITNGDSAAGVMNEARIIGDILPWRDVLHDGPVPGGLSLRQLSRVRASYLSGVGAGDTSELTAAFAARDSVVERYDTYDGVVLWFEWDMYDQLQLIQLLDFFAGQLGAREQPLKLELVSLAGYLGNLSPEKMKELDRQRQPVDLAMLMLGRRAWRAVTSADPNALMELLTADTSRLPFLAGALTRFLEELPWTSDGLARSERQLMEGIASGRKSFGEVFRYAADQEERIYCGDASAADYVRRLAGGSTPLVSFQSNGNVDWREQIFMESELQLTDAGKAVLDRASDWIELGGSDRWLGGMHLEGADASWRWDDDSRKPVASLKG